jgi:hypothetical protein
VLLALGAMAAVLTLVRLRRRASAAPFLHGASCSDDGSCGCGPTGARPRVTARR